MGRFQEVEGEGLRRAGCKAGKKRETKLQPTVNEIVGQMEEEERRKVSRSDLSSVRRFENGRETKFGLVKYTGKRIGCSKAWQKRCKNDR